MGFLECFMGDDSPKINLATAVRAFSIVSSIPIAVRDGLGRVGNPGKALGAGTMAAGYDDQPILGRIEADRALKAVQLLGSRLFLEASYDVRS